MAPELAEFVEILFYLLLTFFGGVAVAVLAILLIILIAALCAWLGLQITASHRRSGVPEPTGSFNKTDSCATAVVRTAFIK